MTPDTRAHVLLATLRRLLGEIAEQAEAARGRCPLAAGQIVRKVEEARKIVGELGEGRG